MAAHSIDELIIKANDQAVTITQMGTVLQNIVGDIATLKSAAEAAAVTNAKVDEAYLVLEGNQNLLVSQLASMVTVDESTP